MVFVGAADLPIFLPNLFDENHGLAHHRGVDFVVKFDFFVVSAQLLGSSCPCFFQEESARIPGR